MIRKMIPVILPGTRERSLCGWAETSFRGHSDHRVTLQRGRLKRAAGVSNHSHITAASPVTQPQGLVTHGAGHAGPGYSWGTAVNPMVGRAVSGSQHCKKGPRDCHSPKRPSQRGARWDSRCNDLRLCRVLEARGSASALQKTQECTSHGKMGTWDTGRLELCPICRSQPSKNKAYAKKVPPLPHPQSAAPPDWQGRTAQGHRPAGAARLTHSDTAEGEGGPPSTNRSHTVNKGVVLCPRPPSVSSAAK